MAASFPAVYRWPQNHADQDRGRRAQFRLLGRDRRSDAKHGRVLPDHGPRRQACRRAEWRLISRAARFRTSSNAARSSSPKTAPRATRARYLQHRRIPGSTMASALAAAPALTIANAGIATGNGRKLRNSRRTWSNWSRNAVPTAGLRSLMGIIFRPNAACLWISCKSTPVARSPPTPEGRHLGQFFFLDTYKSLPPVKPIPVNHPASGAPMSFAAATAMAAAIFVRLH